MKSALVIQIHINEVILHKRFLFFILFFLTVFSFFHPARAQDITREPQSHINAPQNNFWDRVYTGGGIGLQFGSQTFVNISPLVGYRLTEKLSVGLSATYIYYRYKNPNPAFTYSSNIYGGSVFSRYLIFENLFAHVEYEVLRLEARDNVSRLLGTKDVTPVLKWVKEDAEAE